MKDLYLQETIIEHYSTEDLKKMTPMILFSVLIVNSRVELVIKERGSNVMNLVSFRFHSIQFHCDLFKFKLVEF